MKHLCSICGCSTGPDTPGRGISHGLCREDYLGSVHLSSLANTSEIHEWFRLPFDDRCQILARIQDAEKKNAQR